MRLEGVLKLVIITPERVVVDAPVVSVSAVNATGPFDVLPGHENFISIINGTVKYTDMRGKRFEQAVDRAVIKVNRDEVKIFTGLR